MPIPDKKPSNRRRSTRLRKKLRIGEFQEFGFAFEADLDESFSPDAIEKAVHAFLEECVEPRNLGLGGWLGSGYLQSMSRHSATDEDREAVRAWLVKRPEVKAVRVTPLSDCWYMEFGSDTLS